MSVWLEKKKGGGGQIKADQYPPFGPWCSSSWGCKHPPSCWASHRLDHQKGSYLPFGLADSAQEREDVM